MFTTERAKPGKDEELKKEAEGKNEYKKEKDAHYSEKGGHQARGEANKQNPKGGK